MPPGISMLLKMDFRRRREVGLRQEMEKRGVERWAGVDESVAGVEVCVRN